MTLLSAYECHTDFDTAIALTDPIARIKEVDSSEPPNRSINRYFAVPAGFSPYGLKPNSIGTNSGTYNGKAIITLMIGMDDPFETVEAAVLAAHGLTRCPRRAPGRARNCTVFVHTSTPEWEILTLSEYEDQVAISCAYLRPED